MNLNEVMVFQERLILAADWYLRVCPNGIGNVYPQVSPLGALFYHYGVFSVHNQISRLNCEEVEHYIKLSQLMNLPITLFDMGDFWAGFDNIIINFDIIKLGNNEKYIYNKYIYDIGVYLREKYIKVSQ